MIRDCSFEEVKEGDKSNFTKTISESDVYGFAGIIGDFYPLHVNEEFAKKSRFKRRIVHGMLSASFLSTAIGTIFENISLSHEFKFIAPVYIGDTITAEVEVAEKDAETRVITLNTKVVNQDGKTVIEGKARVLKKE